MKKSNNAYKSIGEVAKILYLVNKKNQKHRVKTKVKTTTMKPE